MNRNPSRIVAALALTAVVVSTSSCERKEALTATALGERTWEKVDLRLVDETHLVMKRVHLDGDDMVRGHVVSCAGVSCEGAERDEGVPLASVRAIAALKPAESTTAGWVAVGIISVGAAVAIAAAIATASSTPPPSSGGGGMSCPRMYAWNGTDWQLDSGTYGGSMLAVAPLTDHDLLEHLAPDDGKLRMRLMNELPETEHTDAISLEIVDHPAGTRVVPTASGKLLTFRDPKPPRSATDLRRNDVLDAVAKRDDHEWTSDLSGRDPARPDDARDGLVLDFAKPKGAHTAKLWVAARNTVFASDMLIYLLSRLGPALPAWFSQLNADPGARTRFAAFMAREGSLQVQVQTPKGWVARGALAVAGPEILKDQALEMPVDDIPGDRLVVRLDAPVAFWSIDSVFAAFEANEPIETREILPVAAVADDGTDVKGALSAIDGTSYSTVKGNRADLTFDAPAGPRAGLSRSYVLVSTGYYVPDIPLDPHADPADFARLIADPDAASKRALEMLNATR